MNNPALELRNVARTYRSGETDLHVLRGVDLVLNPGEIVALVAPSGTGKSTLLHAAGLLERPDAGQVLIAGKEAGALDDAGRTAIRRDSIGFVYQFHHLLGEFTALENVMLPQMIAGIARPKAAERARALLADFGLAARTGHFPGKLSGGEQQRVAIAIAIVVTITTIITTASAVPCAHRRLGAGSSCGQLASFGRATWRGRDRLRGVGRARNGRQTIARGGGRGALMMLAMVNNYRDVS